MRRGHAFREKTLLDKAIGDYSAAIKLRPSDGHGYLWRGVALRISRQMDKSVADFSDAIRLATADDRFLLGHAFEGRGHAYRQKGKACAKDAISDFTEALKYSPGDVAGVYWERGLAYQSMGNTAKAAADGKKARELGYRK